MKLERLFNYVLVFLFCFIGLDCSIIQAQNKNDKPSYVIHKTGDPYIEFKRFIPPDFWMILSDGAYIPFRVWQAPNPKAIILAYHGFNDSRDAWEEAAPFFVKKAISLYAPDQRGFGQAPLRGKWAGDRRLIQDVREEVQYIKTRYPNIPLYLMGESMGGAILMCVASQQEALPVNGYIMISPAVWNRKQIGFAGDISLRFMNLVTPYWRVTGRELPKSVVASNNNFALMRLYFDTLSLHDTKISVLSGLVDLMGEASKAAPSIKYPSLVIYGSNDQIVPDAVMKNVWYRFSSSVRKDYILGGYHLLLRDKQNENIVRDITNWIEQPNNWLPSGGDIAAAAWGSMGKPDKVPFYMPAQLDKLMPN